MSAAQTHLPSVVLGIATVLLMGAIFRIFLAWVCTTMWGLDTAPALVAVKAMQDMNASVRNGVFFVPFFLPGPVALCAAVLAYASGNKNAAYILLAAGLIHILGSNGVTFAVNVPMNETLALEAPLTEDDARTLWQAYSPRWQVFNLMRTLADGVAFLLAIIALRQL